MKELLIELNACDAAKDWAADKTWKEVYETCHRGDWLLWLFLRTNPKEKRLLALAKGHCANTVRHLMKDERSIKAVDASIAYGNNDITDSELAYAAAAAYAAAYAAADADAYADAAAAAYAAADADAYAAAAAAAYAAADAYAAAAADADADAYAARIKSQRATADICRKYLPIEVWNI